MKDSLLDLLITVLIVLLYIIIGNEVELSAGAEIVIIGILLAILIALWGKEDLSFVSAGLILILGTFLLGCILVGLIFQDSWSLIILITLEASLWFLSTLSIFFSLLSVVLENIENVKEKIKRSQLSQMWTIAATNAASQELSLFESTQIAFKIHNSYKMSNEYYQRLNEAAIDDYTSAIISEWEKEKEEKQKEEAES